LGNRNCFPQSQEICVEVISPSNTEAEVQEKVALYFDAGAREVWLCETSGVMKFLRKAAATPHKSSPLCPRFPREIEAR
jgi:hypothetical protein